MKRTQNCIALRELRDEIQVAACQDSDEDPSLFVFVRLMRLFHEYKLPMEHVGKIKVQVDEHFFESKKITFQILDAIAQYCKARYDVILSQVGGDEELASKIFGDYLTYNTTLYWMGFPEMPVDFDEL